MPITEPTGAIRTVFGTAPRDVKFSPDGTQIYLASGTQIRVIDAASGTQVGLFELGQQVGAIDVSPDGSTLGAVIQTGAGIPARLNLIEIATGNVVSQTFATGGAITGSFFDIAFAADGRILLTQANGGSLVEYDPETGLTGYLANMAAGTTLVTGIDHQQVLIVQPDLTAGSAIYTSGVGITYARQDRPEPYGGASVPSPQLAVGALSSGSNVYGLGDRLFLRETDGDLLAQINFNFLGQTNGMTFSPTGDRLYVLHNSSQIIVINTATWQPILSYPIGAIAGSPGQAYGDLLQMSPDGRFLSVMSGTGLQLIDLTLAVPLATAGSDIISETFTPIGLAGNDTLDALSGGWMFGGQGDDSYIVDNFSDTPIENAGEGHDRVLLGNVSPYFIPSYVEDVVVTTSAGSTVYGGFENNAMTGAGGIDNFYGNGGNDTLIGNGGNDQLNGGDGDDDLQGGIGNDALDGGNGNDLLGDNSGTNILLGGGGADSLSAEGSNGSTLASHYYGLVNLDTFAEADSLAGSAGNDVFYAGYNDTVSGNGGIDLLNLNLQGAGTGVTIDLRMPAMGGSVANGSGQVAAVITNIVTGSNFNDVITTYWSALDSNFWTLRFEGRAGDDTIVGSGGDAWLYGGSGSDTLTGADGADHLYSHSDYGNASWGEDNALSVDRLDGGGGNDILDAGVGDTVLGGNGTDRLFLNLAAASGGVTLDFGALSTEGGTTLFGGTIAQIEVIDGVILPNFTNMVSRVGQLVASQNQIFGGSGNDTLIGSEFDDMFSGGPSGADTLDGRGGDDLLEGGAGNDLLIGGAGRDRLNGGSGNDTASYADATAGMTISLYWNTASDNAGNVDTLSSIEFIIGSDLADTLQGGEFFNRFYGRGGNDVIDSYFSFGLFDGGSGDDTITLRAGASGSDAFGGDGIDRLILANSIGLADIGGFEQLELQNASVVLSGLQFNSGLATNSAISGTGSLTVNMNSGQAFFATEMAVASTVALTVNGTASIDVIKGPLTAAMTVSAGDGTDQIRTGNLVDTIDGGAGNDKIMGLGGADILTGGAGADQFRFLFTTDSGLGTGADRILDFTNGEDKLDFRVLDANPNIAGRQALSFIGTAAFATNGTAQLRYADSGADMLIQIDLNGDGAADMEIVLAGHAGQALTGTDFLF